MSYDMLDKDGPRTPGTPTPGMHISGRVLPLVS